MDASYFQQQWDKAQHFNEDMVAVMKLLTKTAQAPVSTIKVPLKSSFVKKHDEEATSLVLADSQARRGAKKKKDIAQAEEVSEEDDAALCRAARRGAVAKLCQVLIEPPNTAIPVPYNRCRPLTTLEGQRPLRESKVRKCQHLFSQNPHTTPQQMQMVALDYDLTPDQAAKDYKAIISLDDAWTGSAQPGDLALTYGISGGQHYHLGVQRACEANPKLKEHSHARCHVTEVFAMGWLTRIDSYYQKQKDQDKAHSYTGVDDFETRQYTNDAESQAGIKGILPPALWDSLTPKERTLLPSRETAITMLVREHNDVAQLSDDSTFQEKVQCLRESCEEHNLAPEAASDGCQGVEDTLLGTMAFKIKVKSKKDLMPYLRIALSPQKSWDMLQRVFYLHSAWGLKGQKVPKKKKGAAATTPPLYHRSLSILWEHAVSEDVRTEILSQLLEGDIALKDVKPQKVRQVTIITLLQTLLLHMRWDPVNHASKDEPSSIQAVKDVLKYELSSGYMELLVKSCPAVRAYKHS